MTREQTVSGFVSVVAAVADAQEYVEEFVRECVAVLDGCGCDYELVLVDDASKDETVARVDRLLRELPCLRLVRLARCFGPDVALTAGLDAAIGEHIVLMQAESDPPAEIPALLRLARDGHGVVTGVAPRHEGEPWWRRALRHAYHHLCNRVLGLSYPPYATRFQVLTRAAACAVTRVRHKGPRFPVLASLVGYGGATHTYRPVYRAAGRAGRGLFDKIDRGLSIVVLNSRSPLRLVSYIGMAAGLFNLLYSGYVVVVNLVSNHVAAGWTTLSLQMNLMFLFVFLILVVMCEYVGRIMEEAQDRPLYHVLEERHGSVLPAQGRNVLDRSA
jgi:glycosyltransferase involved in cell wall biosynthesis